MIPSGYLACPPASKLEVVREKMLKLGKGDEKIKEIFEQNREINRESNCFELEK